ncbi:MurR/RpiR family transcriptional regulator [Clostridium neuense]|uniref:MurR/RpiR family transcriptional regulator n=1 Tax=Clostridium neuense TaxID=1728934 RepID=A0ABW8TKQ2_9CLOT
MKNFNSELYLKLQRILNGSDYNNTYKILSKNLIENLENFKHMTIEKFAAISFTSISTVSRFVRLLGFKNFIELKEYSQSYKLYRFMNMNDNIEHMKFDMLHDNDILNNYIDDICTSLQGLKNNVDFKKIDKINELIYNANSISLYAFLLPGSLAKFYQLSMLSLGKCSKYYDLTNANLSTDDYENELSLFFSVDGNFIESSRDIIIKLKANNKKLVLITQNPRVRLCNMFDEILFMGNNDSSKGGRYKLMIFIELLLNRYYLTYYKDELSNFN